jgi:hypothetical protein
MYECRIIAETLVGPGPPCDSTIVATLQDRPQGSPTALASTFSNSTAIKITWSPPPLSMRNGIILGYTVQFKRNSSSDIYFNSSDDIHVLNISDSTPAPSALVTGLFPYSAYDFQIAAYTEIPGDGPFSGIVTMMTGPSTPTGPPTNIHLVSLTKSSIAVGWTAPPFLERNGPLISFTVTALSAALRISANVSASVAVHVIDGLVPGTAYSVRVQVCYQLRICDL